MSAIERGPNPEEIEPPWMEPNIKGEDRHVGRLMKSAFPPAGASDALKRRLIQQSLNILGEGQVKGEKVYPRGLPAADPISLPNELEPEERRVSKRRDV